MILSGRDVDWYISTGKLVIEPLGVGQVQQNGIDLILGEVENRERPFSHGEFRLGCTREHISMPDNLMAFVQLRSTWARSGFVVPPTVVDAGFVGTLTLEILSFRKQLAPIGERFVHLIFGMLSGPATPYAGKYQGQRGITGVR